MFSAKRSYSSNTSCSSGDSSSFEVLGRAIFEGEVSIILKCGRNALC